MREVEDWDSVRWVFFGKCIYELIFRRWAAGKAGGCGRGWTSGAGCILSAKV